MYEKIINKIIELGDTLPAIAGHVVDMKENKNDVEIEAQLVNLINTFPGIHSIYAEELHNTFVEGENVWIIDPISNTKNFLHGMPHYSIVLSHLYKGELQFAVVYDPSNKELFTAEKGKGAYLNNKRIHVSNRKEKLFFLVSSPREHGEKALKAIEAVSKNGNIIRTLGSFAVHYAYVACSRVDAAISFNEDTFPEFAGKLLVEEAGGKFTDFDGNDLNVKTVGIIASNGLIHDQVQTMVSSVV